MQLFGLTIERTKSVQLQPLSGRGGWWSVIREPYTGAWQRNDEIKMDTVLTYGAVFACVKTISQDVAKCMLRLVEEVAPEIWEPVTSSAFSPVLREPNHYQTRVKFVEQWITSKLIHGNAYLLKRRDNRGVVTALYVLDPTRVTPLVSTSGDVYYELKRDDLSGLSLDTVTVPASEIIHDLMIAMYHPLVGVSPIYACGVAAMQGLKIQNNSSKFFENLSQPGGMLTAPGSITDETAGRLKTAFETNFSGDNIGRLFVGGDGLKYDPMAVNAVDAQLIEQLKWTGDNVCTAFGMPPYLINIGPPPPYANAAPLIQLYYSQCVQSVMVSSETALDKGLGLVGKIDGRQYGTEFDINDLIWMDADAKSKAAGDAIGSGAMSPNEARRRYFGLGAVAGGDSPYLQVQNYSLSALAKRDAGDPFAAPPQQLLPAPTVTSEPIDAVPADTAAKFAALVRAKAVAKGLRAA